MHDLAQQRPNFVMALNSLALLRCRLARCEKAEFGAAVLDVLVDLTHLGGGDVALFRNTGT